MAKPLKRLPQSLLLTIALAIAPIVLATWAVYLQTSINNGTPVVLPINGYDPRDLLRGHYLQFQVVLPQQTPNPCQQNQDYAPKPATVCLKTTANGCALPLKGECTGPHFNLREYKIYLTEDPAILNQLQQHINAQQASIRLSVTANGTPYIQQLLINNQPWQTSLENK